MNFYLKSATSIALAALLLQGCGGDSAPSSEKSTQTPQTTISEQPTSLTQPALATTASSLVNTRHNIQRELAQASSRQASSRALTSEYKLSDIIYAYTTDNRNSSEGTHLQKNSAKLFIDSMVNNGNFTPEEISEIASYTNDELNQLFIAAFFKDTDSLVQNSSQVNRRIFGIGSKLKDIGRKIDDEIHDAIVEPVREVVTGDPDVSVVDKIEEEVDRVIDDVETVVDKVEEEVERVIDDVEEVADKVEDKIQDEIIDPLQEKVESEIVEPIKEGVTDLIVNTSLGQQLTAEVFKLMLESGTMTNEMLRLAIDSQTITDIMVGVLKENWGLTKKMVPLLEDPNDTTFSRLFTELALTRNGVVPLVFTYMDASMYSAIGTAMINSTQTTENMGKLMELHAKTYFIIPTAPYFEEHSLDKFPEMLFYSGDDNVRGDGFELQNEKFFYALFQNSKATRSFIIAMNQLEPEVRKVFMDVIFLGKYSLPTGNADNPDTEADESSFSASNTIQAYMNIYAIAGGMAFGIKTEGLEAYQASFTDFAKMVPYDRYFPYGKNFSTAAYYYFKAHGIDTAPLTTLTTEVMFNYDSSASQAPQRRAEEVSTTNDQLSFFDKLFAKFDTVKDSLGNSFGSYTEWWENAKGQFKTLSSDSISSIESLDIDAIKQSLHDKTQEKVQVQINDEEYTLPPFDEINIEYIKNQITTRLTDYVKGIDKEWIAEHSDNKYVQEHIYDGLKDSELWAYIPNWMAKMDWLKVPANANFEHFKVDVKTGTLSVYLVSKNDNLAELQAILGNNILLREVNMHGDEPLSTDETSEFKVYAFDIKASDALNIDFKALKEKVSGIAFNKDNAQVTAAE